MPPDNFGTYIIYYLLYSFTVPCAPGNFYDVEEKACKFCPLSHYQDESGQIFCVQCPSGNITRRKGANSPEGCIGEHLLHLHVLEYEFTLHIAYAFLNMIIL